MGVHNPPTWLARLGRSGWLVTGVIVGAAAFIAGLGAVLAVLAPLLVTLVVAAALQPFVQWLRRHGASAALAALVGALLVPALLVVLGLLLVRTFAGMGAAWSDVLASAGEEVHAALGADPLNTLLGSPQWRTAVLGVGSAVLSGAALAVQAAIGVFVAAFVLYYLFKDGPAGVAWLDRRLPLRPGLTRQLLDGAALRMRRYIVGTAVVAAMDTVVITLGAVALRLPLIGMIALITFVAAFVPYLGAWVSAAFVVVVALGAGGPAAAAWMLVIVLVTQNILEGVLRPFVFGRALDLHPVVILAVTVVGGALAGLVGVLLAPPVAAIAVWWRQMLHDEPPAEPPAEPRDTLPDVPGKA
ncbi:AI-2E family transporter [Dactylosporangium aurantiacum]|uniref:AI-2E family transporter n=1 Tax=Dactylosporangium aurantiacum TaxID=35754 RepID=A0A9Q9MEV3_9ACTN|nr:AI-2E family transporter [Dactylosporangium aurantiacum]MDG6103630.1 AI-2E family transporter [Dactylosporangium aurantiacum]UWZ51880.1 AI-2E family transporter [Dactylosporangium aurantiacum]